MKLLQNFIDREIELANGCTEPAAVAYSVARAADFLEGKLKKIVVEMDGYVYKNGLRTGIPGTEEYGGNKLAAAIGYFIRDSADKKLTLLNGLNKDTIKKAKEINDLIKLKLIKDKKELFIKTTLYGDNIVESLIVEDHTNLKYIKVNQDYIYRNEDSLEKDSIEYNLKYEFGSMSIKEIIQLVENQYDDSMISYLEQGLKINQKLVESGLKDQGCGIGRSYLKMAGDDFIRKSAAKLAAGTDARMSGVKLPAMTSSGSGNQGIFITIGVYLSGLEKNIEKTKLFKGTLVAHLIAYYIKIKMGKLSSLCGLFTAAAPGLLAALLYFDNNNVKIEEAINNIYSDSGGVLCDGAKTSCAFKTISAYELAHRHYSFIKDNLKCPLPTGYINKDFKKTLNNQYALLNPDGVSFNDTLIETIKNNFSK
ncbi:MAG: L-serine ammonia-lyase, iron-sulfur-dependent, subunit alpha [Halanaerobiales bacterium]|nr:L-serine ammonia-lyase, iron-sulfur-dependent, subunit alpha [Halanaerobiales bacterium]MCF8009258.1 L-serine ammonia-lyase, iron-sulfur-dependent, subunit alpha [Halanaerobiales bacterium]